MRGGQKKDGPSRRHPTLKRLVVSTLLLQALGCILTHEDH